MGRLFGYSLSCSFLMPETMAPVAKLQTIEPSLVRSFTTLPASLVAYANAAQILMEMQGGVALAQECLKRVESLCGMDEEPAPPAAT